MVCIHCGSETSVINSRPQKRLNQIWRRRRCNSCDSVFTTQETAHYDAAWLVLGRSGSLEAFSRDKLFISIHKSIQHRSTALSDAGSLTNTVIKKLAAQTQSGAVSSKIIAQIVQVALNRFDKAASSHYQAFHRN